MAKRWPYEDDRQKLTKLRRDLLHDKKQAEVWQKKSKLPGWQSYRESIEADIEKVEKKLWAKFRFRGRFKEYQGTVKV